MAKDINDPKAVSDFIEKLEPGFAQLVEAVRQLILSTDAEIGEQIKWNSASFFYMGAMADFNPKAYNRDIVVTNMRKGTLLLVLPTGAKLADATGLLEGNYTDGRRLVTFKNLAEVQANGPALQALLKQWLLMVEKP